MGEHCTVEGVVEHLIFQNEENGYTVLSLVTDQVSEKREELVSTGRSGRLEKALYFVHYGRYLPSDTVYELTDPGDTFYLVIVEARKPVISLAYHTEMYTDKERSY